MDIIKINLSSYDTDLLQNLAKRITNGETAVIPTDTCYGLAANPNIKSAIENVYKIKNRELKKQIGCIFKDVNQIKNHPFKPDFIIDAGILPQHESSTVVDIRTSKVKILREGLGHLKY